MIHQYKGIILPLLSFHCAFDSMNITNHLCSINIKNQPTNRIRIKTTHSGSDSSLQKVEDLP